LAKDVESGVAPIWAADHESNVCTQCKDGFTFFNRRHHCRFCGDLICGKCSTNKLPSNLDPKKKERACDLCKKDFDMIAKGGSLEATRVSKLNMKPAFLIWALKKNSILTGRKLKQDSSLDLEYQAGVLPPSAK